VGQVDAGLDEFFELGAPDFVQQQRQDDRRRERQQVEAADRQRVPEHGIELGISKQNLEMLQADPLTSYEPQVRVVVLERHQDSGERQILEQEQHDEAWQTQQVDVAVVDDPLHQAFPVHADSLFTARGVQINTRQHDHPFQIFLLPDYFMQPMAAWVNQASRQSYSSVSAP
jgi:hypothetical protein